MPANKARLNIAYTVEIWREGRVCVARAAPLDVMTCGTSAPVARRNLRAAVDLFLAAAAEHGTLAQVLRECGYRKTSSVWQPPRLLTRTHVRHAVNA